MKESQARIRSSRYRSQKIIAAAMELFCEKGIEQTSVDEIAAHAGVGSATIYRSLSRRRRFSNTCRNLTYSSSRTGWRKRS